MLGNKGTKKFYRTGGTRGGQDHFKWDDVKTDKERENYLGHSMHAPVGRWQKGRDILWYARDSGTSTVINTVAEEEKKRLDDEKRRIKEMDEDMLNQALGFKSSRKRQYSDTLEVDEVKQLMAKGLLDRDQEVGLIAERVGGLGAEPVRLHEHIERISNLEKQIQRLKEGKQLLQEEDINRLPGTAAVTAGRPEEGKASPHRSVDDDGSSRSSSDEKKKKKTTKKHHHHHHHHHRSVEEGEEDGRRMQLKKQHRHKHDKKTKKHKHRSDDDSKRHRSDDDSKRHEEKY